MSVLKNKTAIITGAGSGIGKATALLFAQEGCQIILSDIDEENGKTVAKEIKKNDGEAFFQKTDVSNPEDHEKLVKLADEKFGGLHIAINNAGIGGPLNTVTEYPTDEWQNVIDINLSGIFYGMKYQIPAIIASGGGNIINNASILGSVGTKNSPAYVASKHGAVGLTKAAALEYADQNIRINSVGPGYIKTPLINSLDDDTLSALTSLHPIGRLGESREVAELILWLASSKASFVTGSYYPVDGGYLAQ